MAIRVQFVNSNLGGHATMHLHLRRALADHPDIVPTFFDIPEPKLLRRLLAAPVPGLGRWDLDLHALREQLVRSAVVRRHLAESAAGADVLHVYTQEIAFLAVGHMREVPTVVSMDATNRQNAYRLPQRAPTKFTRWTVPFSTVFERRVYNAAAKIAAHSHWAADALVSEGVPAARIEVIPFGITVTPDSPHESDGDLPRIVFIGRQMDRKGGWRLLNLWRSALAGSARLTLVTRDPVPAEPGLEVRNDIRPGDGQLEALLARCDIFAMASEIDPFGYAVLECMNAGLPVVAAPVAALPEIIEDGVTGVLVPPSDDDAYVAALRTLIADPDRRRAMGAAGRRRVLERFDARITTAQLASLLRDVATTGVPRPS